MKAFRLFISIAALLVCTSPAEAAPEGTLTVAVATFGNERWLPNLYVGAEDVVLKPMFENLLTRDAKGELAPSLAERWQVLDGGKTWKFYLRKGVRFHNGAELTAEDVRFTFATLAKEGSANSLAPEFRLIKSMEVENPLTAEAGYGGGFDLTMNLTAWPGRGYLPDVGEAVATYWEKIGIRVKRRPVDRAVFAADFRARAYSGVTVAYAAPLVAPEPWEVLYRGGYTKGSLNLFMEHPRLDEFIDRLAVQPNHAERVRIMREEMLPWLHDYVPAVAIGAMHAIAGVGPKVGEWPLIPGHMGFHNWELVTRR